MRAEERRLALHPLGAPSQDPCTTAILLVHIPESARLVTKSRCYPGNAGCKGEDDSRSLVERVENFAPRYTDKVVLFDTVEFALPGISDRVRALVSPILLATVFERLSAHLEVKRSHPLTTRRYYKRVAY